MRIFLLDFEVTWSYCNVYMNACRVWLMFDALNEILVERYGWKFQLTTENAVVFSQV